MTCHDAREQFSALMDAALGPDERAMVDAHLAGCAECRRELERLRATVALLGRIAPARAPAGFVDRVLAAARPAPWYRRLVHVAFRPWPVKLPLEAAALVLVGVTVALVFRATPGLQQAARLEPAPPAVSEAPARPAPPPAIGETQRLTPEPKFAEPAPRRSAPAPATAPGPETKAAPAEPETASRLAATPGAAPRESAPPVADGREVPKARDRLGKSAERAKLADEAEAPRGPDAAKTEPAVQESVDVTGRLAVSDREAALRALAELLKRAGGREVARRPLPDGLAVDLAIPRAAWAEFARELARLGRFTAESPAGERPDQVRVTLRISD